MPRRVRDMAAAIAVLLVILGTLMSIDPRVRESVDRFTGGANHAEWSASGGAVRAAVAGVLVPVVSTTSGYAADNPYLFAFLIVAIVLFVLMVRT